MNLLIQKSQPIHKYYICLYIFIYIKYSLNIEMQGGNRRKDREIPRIRGGYKNHLRE